MNEKQDRFCRIYPDRVKRLIKSLEVLGNCANKSSYEWDEDLVKRTWVEIGKCFHGVAADFDVDFVLTLDGRNIADIDTSEPLQ